MTIKQAPAILLHLLHPEWTDIAEKIEEAKGGGNVFLAGGALRDMLNEVEVKDLDFWLYVDPEKRNEVTQKLIAVFGEPDLEMSTGSTLGNERHIDYILQFPTDSLPIQVIFLATDLSLEELLADFDFGICQIGCDGKDIVATQAFADDCINKTLTYMRHGETEGRVSGRLARLQEKYPEHKAVGIPDYTIH
ncbi:nucleotidyltransferase family protein [Marinobacter similis]|nr:hypothetical protein [Marinobacter similis]